MMIAERAAEWILEENTKKEQEEAKKEKEKYTGKEQQENSRKGQGKVAREEL